MEAFWVGRRPNSATDILFYILVTPTAENSIIAIHNLLWIHMNKEKRARGLDQTSQKEGQ